jgi:DNA-binding MarR family transcriptional regulator
MSLLPRTLAYEQSHRKTRDVLSFLRTSVYSTEPLLGQVMRIKHRSTVHNALVRLEQAGLIRRAPIRTAMASVTLWGITSEGQQLATPSGEEISPLTFNISKVSVSRLDHYLSLQQIRITGERFGWTEFIYCDRETRANPDKAESKYNVRPDLTALDPHGRRVAIECELSLKSPARYKDNIIPGHIRHLNAEEYDYVLWITRTLPDQQTLHQSLTARIQDLREEQRLHLTRTFTDYKMFQFANLETWLKPQLVVVSNGGQH